MALFVAHGFLYLSQYGPLEYKRFSHPWSQWSKHTEIQEWTHWYRITSNWKNEHFLLIWWFVAEHHITIILKWLCQNFLITEVRTEENDYKSLLHLSPYYTDLSPKILCRRMHTRRVIFFLKADQASSLLAPSRTWGCVESSKKGLPSAVYSNHLWRMRQLLYVDTVHFIKKKNVLKCIS